MGKNLFAINIEGMENIKLNKCTYNILRVYYKYIYKLGSILAKIIQRPIKLHRFITFSIDGKYYRKLCMLDIIYYNKFSKTYKCGFCHRTMFKGIINRCIIINCPGCGRQFTLYRDTYNHMINVSSSVQDEIDENTYIDNGIRYDVKILGKTITVKG